LKINVFSRQIYSIVSLHVNNCLTELPLNNKIFFKDIVQLILNSTAPLRTDASMFSEEEFQLWD